MPDENYTLVLRKTRILITVDIFVILARSHTKEYIFSHVFVTSDQVSRKSVWLALAHPSQFFTHSTSPTDIFVWVGSFFSTCVWCYFPKQPERTIADLNWKSHSEKKWRPTCTAVQKNYLFKEMRKRRRAGGTSPRKW